MNLLTAGYWQTTYWSSRYWSQDYWSEYGAILPATIRISAETVAGITISSESQQSINIESSEGADYGYYDPEYFDPDYYVTWRPNIKIESETR